MKLLCLPFPLLFIGIVIFAAGCDFQGSLIHVDPEQLERPDSATSPLSQDSETTPLDTASSSDSAVTLPDTNYWNDTDSTPVFPLDSDTQSDIYPAFDTASDSDTIPLTESTDSETTSDSTDDTVADTLSVIDTDTVSDTGTDTLNNADTDTLSNGGIDTETELNLSDLISDDMWTFYSIADMQNGPITGVNHIRSMYIHDPAAVALFEVGDLTNNALLPQWEEHHQALETGALDAGGPADYFKTDATDWGDFTRFVGIQGNHDTYSSSWFDYWNQFLPGQQSLGANSQNGIYFSLAYQNTLFIILDSNHFSQEQTDWLEAVLHSQFAQNARWKIAFFHEPVYPCDSKSPKDQAIPWVSLFEEHQVDLVVHGHAHTFERTCPMKNGACASPDEHGVTYLVASGGGTSYLRTVDPLDTGSLTYGDRTDTYQCSEILEDYDSLWNHFCHYAVGNCRFIVRCYDHDYWAGGELRHQFMLEKCK